MILLREESPGYKLEAGVGVEKKEARVPSLVSSANTSTNSISEHYIVVSLFDEYTALTQCKNKRT